MAGVELAAGALRAVIARREDGRLRVSGSAAVAVPAGAIAGGLVMDRSTVSAALASALTSAEGRERATRVIVALDGDDLRTFHTATAFERVEQHEAIAASELQRAVREAREEAARAGRTAAAEDPALRGIVTTQVDAAVAGFQLDGRSLEQLQGFHGRSIVVFTDVAIAPLLHAGAVSAVLDAVKRRGGATSGAYALGRLLAASGFTDGAVLRLGPDVTAYAVIREGRVIATRAFALGRDALLARPGRTAGDAAVWARCVLSPHDGIDGQLPARWSVVGIPDELLTLPRALADALSAQRGSGRVEITPLRVPEVGRLVSDSELRPDQLVAAGAAAIAADA